MKYVEIYGLGVYLFGHCRRTEHLRKCGVPSVVCSHDMGQRIDMNTYITVTAMHHMCSND